MRYSLLTAMMLLVTGLLPAAEPASIGAALKGMTVWDTGKPSGSAEPLATLTSVKDWAAITAETAASFKGDAAISNGKILAMLRKHEAAVDVYSVQEDSVVFRLRLRLLASGGEKAERLEKAALVENTKGTVCLEATGKTAKGAEVVARFRLKRGDVTVQAEPGNGAATLRVECPSRFVVLPDFFADDIMIDAAKTPPPAIDIPSENFVLQPTGANDAIAMCVFENRQHDVRLTLAGDGAKRIVTGTEIGFEKKKVWVALMVGPQLWHEVDIQAAQVGKVVPLSWSMPYTAQWRVDFSRPNGLVDSWDMLLQPKKGAEYIKPAWFGGPAEKVNDATRRRFTEVLGFFPYPAWTDHEKRGFLQPLDLKTRTKFVEELKYQGPALVYPFNRLTETPPDQFTMVDVARNALGVGPCQYILDLEGQKSEYKGVATCNAQDALIAIYEKGLQKKQRADVEKNLADALIFVTHIRGRITNYVEFGKKTRSYLAEQKQAHPEIKDQIAELEKIAQEIELRFAEREERIGSVALVAKMNDDFRKNVLDAEGPDAVAKCKKYTDELVRIGGNQDKLVSECRWVVRTLRQRAGLMVALDPRLAAIAAELRTRTQAVLRNPSNHERPNG